MAAANPEGPPPMTHTSKSRTGQSYTKSGAPDEPSHVGAGGSVRYPAGMPTPRDPSDPKSSGPPTQKPPPLPRPQRLLGGKYEPVRPAGEGGMASVWLGYTHGEAGFRRKVAI